MEFGFNLDDVEVSNDYDDLPDGWYKVRCEKTEETTSKAGNPMLSVLYKVVDGKFGNRTIYDNLSIKHPNPKTVEIAQQSLKKMCLCTGIEPSKLRKSEQFHGKVLMVKIKTVVGKDGKNFTNVKQFKPVETVTVDTSTSQDGIAW